jgi:hypothetical protein
MKIPKLLLIATLSITAMMPMTSFAAQILSQSRSLQAIVDAMDFNPATGDEVSDFKSAPGFGGFNASAGVTFPFNNNLASSISTQNTQIDTTALRIYGSGNTANHINTRFDIADVTTGAFVNTQTYSGVSAAFKLGNSGKVHVALTLETAVNALDTSGVPIAEARIQTATGVVVWHQLISATNRMTFAGDIPLAAGSYQISIIAASNITDSKADTRIVDTNAAFTIDATISEDAGAPSHKKK